MKSTITTMTALAVILAAVPGVQAGKMPIVKIQPKPQVVKIKPPNIQIHRRLPKPARVLRKNDKPPQKSEKPADPAPGPAIAAIKPEQSPAVPPLPRPRPYNEFEEAGNGADAGPETELPQEDRLFDEDLVARLPGLWGNDEQSALEDAGRGARDGAFDDPPDGVDPFGFGGKDAGPDLAGLNPYEPGVQPGGPNDPNKRDQIPGFINGSPYGPKPDDGNQDRGNPSNVIPDPRGMASDGDSSDDPDVESTRTEQRGNTTYTWTRFSDGTRTVSKTRDNGDESTSTDRLTYDADGEKASYSHTNDWGGGHVVADHWNADGSSMHVVSFEGETWTTRVDADGRGFTVGPNGEVEYFGPESQPAPIDGTDGGIDVAMCGNLIPMYVCMRGASGGATPNDMLTQPSEGGSIIGSGEGEDLGLRGDMVTNTGDGSFNTERGRGGGGGSGGMQDWRDPGDPEDPDGPGGAGGS